MASYHDLFSIGKEYLEKVKNTQQEPIRIVAKMMGDCMLDNGIVQLFGLDHNHAFTMEMFYRAGGLMPFHGFNPRDLVLRGIVTKDDFDKPDFLYRQETVDKMWDIYNIQPNDMFVLTSDLGVEGCVIDMAIKVKKHGHKLVVVTSLKESQKLTSKHPSGKKLYEFADVVIDSCVANPDVVIKLKNGILINQMATITGNTLAQMITAEIYKYLVDLGEEAPVLLSANVTGADVHNRAISDKYLGRWNA